MTNRFYHAGTATIVQFSSNPLRGNGEQQQRHQISAHDSNGVPYIYAKNKTTNRTTTVIYSHQTSATLALLATFIQARNGDKALFTFDDHNGLAHSVHFTNGAMKYQQQPGGRYRIEIGISEDL